MANTIKIKNSGNSTSAPSSLEFGELAINYADGVLYYKNLSNTIVSLSTAGGSSQNILDLQVSLAMEIP